MRFPLAIPALLISAIRLAAGTVAPIPVDISNASSQFLNPQDALLFTVSGRSFEINAPEHGLALYPSHVTFQFITAPESGTANFTAFLESSDASVSVDFPGTFSWLPGYMDSAEYTGPVSVLYGSMDLSPQLSAELFANPLMVLGLENHGSPVDVGLPNYKMDGDLSMSFSAAGFGVSGPVLRTHYLDPPVGVPEPNPGRLLFTVGVILWIAGKSFGRWWRRGA